RPPPPCSRPPPPPAPPRAGPPPRPDRPALHESPQVLRQRTGRRVPPRRLARTRLGDDRLQVPRHARRPPPEPLRLLVHHPLDQRRPVRRLEGPPQRHQLVERQTHA